RRCRSFTGGWSAAATRTSPATSGGFARAISTKRACWAGEGHGTGRLADHLRGTRAVLHEGRVGARRVGRTGSVRSSSIASLSHAAAAGEIVRRAPGARRASTRPSPAADADGDQLAVL